MQLSHREPGEGAVIPFSSGLSVTLTSIAGGLVGLPAFVGFGSSAPAFDVLGASINLYQHLASDLNHAFVVPRT